MEQNTSNKNEKKRSFIQHNNRVDKVNNQYNYQEIHNIQAPSVLPAFLQNVKEYIGLIMAILGALSTLFTAVILTCIWLYLRDLGSEDLFLDSVASANTIALVLVGAFVLALLTLGIFFPSIYIFGLLTIPYKDRRPPLELLAPYLISPFIYLSCFILLLGLTDNILLYLNSLSFLIVFSILLSRLKRGEDKIITKVLDSIMATNKWADIIGICMFLVISCWVCLVPVYFLNKLWILQIKGFFSSFVFVFCIWIGYIPGAALLIALHYRKSFLTTILMVITVIVVLAVTVMLTFPIKIRTVIFEFTGIYSKKEQIFWLIDQNLRGEITKRFSSSNEKKQDIEKNQHNNLFFRAYNNYSLGNVRLLCKEKINPNQIENSSKDNLLSSCFIFKPDEVRRMYREIDSQGSKVQD